jgi:arylsulfatase A-like enzyme
MYDPADVTFPVRAETPDAEARQHPYLEFCLHHQRDSPYSFGKSTRDNLRLDERELRQLRATYYGMMSEVDRQIGRLTAFLRESGLYDSTLVVFVSDHGEQLGDHWQLSKLGYFEQTFHVPLIVRDPDRAGDAARGSAVEAFTENVDVMPTVLDWLGLSVPAPCDGESLLPLCRGQELTQWREQAHFELDFRNFRDAGGNLPLGLEPDQCNFAAVRGKRYKYVHFTALPALFFDLQEDPWEFRNLAADPGHRELVLEHAQMLLSWRMNHAERTLANLRLTPQGAVSYGGRRR